MENLRSYFKEMDFEAFGTGGFSTPAQALPTLIKNNAFLIDLRSREEVEQLSLPFSVNIPLNELPERLEEIPKDILIVLFADGPWRASVGLAYLTAKGFDEISIIPPGLPEMLKTLKPGPLFTAGLRGQNSSSPHAAQRCCRG